MKKPPTANPLPQGSIQPHRGQYTLRIRLGGVQTRYQLGPLKEMSLARAREKADAWIEFMVNGGYSHEAPPPTAGEMTVKGHFEAWTSGDLQKRYGDVNGLKPKASANVDAWRAGKWVYPEIGSKRVVDVTDQDIEKVLAAIPEEQAGTRVKVFALLSRGFDLAVRPARLREDSPVTKYQRPQRPAKKLFAYLFPDELLALLRCGGIPLGRRVFYAIAVYTGLRKSSLYALRWHAIGLDTRTLLSQVSKNGVPQYFEIPAGLVWILRAWHMHCGRPAQDKPVVAHLKIERGKGGEAEVLREDLQLAGVTREVLFARPAPAPVTTKKRKNAKAIKVDEPDNVEPLRFHDLRATFVTWAKRAGKTEGWIADRTGHLSTEMIDRYSRAARTLEDLGIEPFPELEGTIPELVQLVPTEGGEGGPNVNGGGGE